MKRTIVTFSVLIFAILLACSVVEVVRNEQQYFPLGESNTWVYEVRGGEKVDTVTYRMKQIDPGVYTWDDRSKKAIEPEYASIMSGTTLIDGAEPFDDSSKIIIDSALQLSWRGVGDIPLDEDYINQVTMYSISTPAGTFEDCILFEGKPQENGSFYEVWLAPDIGPVQIYRMYGNDIILEYRLIDFIPAS